MTRPRRHFARVVVARNLELPQAHSAMQFELGCDSKLGDLYISQGTIGWKGWHWKGKPVRMTHSQFADIMNKACGR